MQTFLTTLSHTPRGGTSIDKRQKFCYNFGAIFRKVVLAVKKLLKLLFSRLAFVALFMLLQLAVLVSTLIYFQDIFATVQTASVVLSLIAVVYIINQDGSSAFKIAWLIPIVFLPIFGVPIYILFGKKRTPESKREQLSGMLLRYRQTASMVASKTADIEKAEPDAALQSAYLERCAGAPVFTRTETKYFRLGDELFPAMLEELKRAKRYIFLEYFIVEPGVMWDSILEILEDKAAAGLDVRLIYDDMGCILTLPRNYNKQMEKRGIKCCTFHRFQPVLTGTFNNRDHRKICVIDGAVAFTGGVNLADEYINRCERFGHWLDCGIMLRGEAAYSFALMFLSMWDYIRHEEDDPQRFLPRPELLRDVKSDGFVQPYSDAPSDDEPVGETAYINMLSRAKRYVYICTPYLVIDNELMNALTSAAKCGVDVRMITPGVPDKWYVHMVTRSYYAPLLRAGVKVYEYIPGFIHSKTMISDDEYGICGTINLDYRSLYLHHECAVWMHGSSAIGEIKASFLDTLHRCVEITPELYRNRPWIMRLGQSLLRVFAPLM